MKLMLLCLLMSMPCSAASVECPVKETVAYSRQTTPGMPGHKDRPVRFSYFIYVVLKEGAVPSAAGIWLEGKYRAATLRRVDAPVVVEHDVAVPTGQVDTLVGKTSDDVYQVEPGVERPWSPKDDAETKLIQGNQAVVFLEVGKATCHCPVKEIKALRPAFGM